MILIDALYINKSGGKVLFEYIISTLRKFGNINNCFFIIDNRLKSDITSLIPLSNISILNPSERDRKGIYKKLLLEKNIESILCINNIPPPVVTSKQNVYIYFHNTLLLSTQNLKYSIFERLKFGIKAAYIRSKNRKDYFWIVQSGLIKKLLQKSFKIRENNILVLPFYNDQVGPLVHSKKFQFLYIADGVPQKNHDLLFSVWKNLAERHRIFPKLILTIDITQFPGLYKKIAKLVNQGLQIENLGVCDRDFLMSLYENSEYMVFPSLTESFGLPLIEAALLGCKVIAADLPYVHEVIEPSAIFRVDDPGQLECLICDLYERTTILPLTKVVAENKIFKLFDLLN